jgi:hypothetical protein
VTEGIALRQDLHVQVGTPFLERIHGKLQELTITLAVSLTLFAQLFFVHTSCPQFPTLASTMKRPSIVVAMVVRLYLDASRPNHDTL